MIARHFARVYQHQNGILTIAFSYQYWACSEIVIGYFSVVSQIFELYFDFIIKFFNQSADDYESVARLIRMDSKTDEYKNQII